MALAYVPPGVTIDELYSASVNPLLAANAQVCLLGRAQGYQVVTATINLATRDPDDGTLTLTAPGTSEFVPVSGTETFESVTNFNNPSVGSMEGGGYAQGVGADFTATVSGDRKTVVITPVADGTMDLDSGYVRIRYRFIDDKYFAPTRFSNNAAIEQKYGPAFDDSGIATPLSAAAALAFENGAASVVVQPVFALGTPGDITTARVPTIGANGEYFDPATWATTLERLRDIEDINIIVPVIGQSQGFSDDDVREVFQAVQDHVFFMEGQGQSVVCIFGEDSSASVTTATADTLRAHADVLRSRLGSQVAENTVLVSPSRFTRTSTTQRGTQLVVGGQYAAAAVAGMLANRPTTQPLTRKQLSGFSSVADPRDKTGKDDDAAHGLMVIEQRGLAVHVRHGLTVDITSTARRELSVVRAKHRLIESIRNTIENQIIGEVPADGNAPMVVQQAIIGVLEMVRGIRLIVNYSGVQARTLSNDPTTVEVRFSYRPAFPLNYVTVVFSLDMSSGELTTTIDDRSAI